MYSSMSSSSSEKETENIVQKLALLTEIEHEEKQIVKKVFVNFRQMKLELNYQIVPSSLKYSLRSSLSFTKTFTSEGSGSGLGWGSGSADLLELSARQIPFKVINKQLSIHKN